MSRPIRIVTHLLQSARRLLHSGQHRQARDVLRRLEAFPLTNTVAGRVKALLAEGCLRRRNFARAQRLLAQAADLRPACPRIAFLLGLAWAEDPVAARAHFLRSLELAPQRARCLAEAGLATVRMGEADEGISLLREAVALSPGEARLVGMLVQGLCDAGRPEEARSAINAARFLAPRCPVLQEMLLRLGSDGLRRRQASRPRPEAELVFLPFVRPEGETTSRPERSGTAVLLPGPHSLRPRRLTMRRPS